MSFDGAYTANVSSELRSGSVIVKKSRSLLPWLLMLDILQPLFFLRRTRIPRFLARFPCTVYFEKRVLCRFLSVFSFDSQMWESIMMLMSLFRLKNVCNLADSLCVPVFEPLRLVEVIEILLADFEFCGAIFFFL